ncbi:MAG: class II fructose-bisphosphate aldolase [Eubacteriales bacterium]|nr:class II fructose-bisphosphate aldolase [Eubacteriales bacterium]
MIVRDASQTREIYRQAGEKGWVLPCLCSENLTTSEAILAAAEEFRVEHGLKTVPVILAITARYTHRSQCANYTATRDPDLGLKLFTRDAVELGEYYKNVQLMLHLDHIQHDLDLELLNGDLTDYASIMYDASNLPLEQNIVKTAEFVRRRHNDILIEGACDEIVDATGTQHNAITTPERAEEYFNRTGADLIVANLGTEHRASGKDLHYYGDAARAIKARIGANIVLHGTSSVPNDTVRSLYADGVCKVNIWTALERDSSPALLDDMVRHASKVGGPKAVEKLVADGYLTEKCATGEATALTHFTTVYRQDVIFDRMKKMVRDYLEMWYVCK